MKRRTFLQSGVGIGVGIGLGVCGQSGWARRLQEIQPRRILLRSSWQTVNIGDIAHTPGVLAILEQYFPEVEISLWPSSVGNGVEEMLLKRFPKLKILKTASERADAFDRCEFLLHGSGPSLVAEKDVRRWKDETGKPFGVYGITLAPKESSATQDVADETMQQTIELLSEASFVYFRDSKSLEFAKNRGCRCEAMAFGPDGAFACDLRNDSAADQYLEEQGLEPGKFLCCIPRLRYTPYWTIPEKNRPLDPVKHARNEDMKEHDHLQLRRAIMEIIENSDNKVLLCPEDQTQMQVGKEMLYDPLPENIKQRVVWRDRYWLTDEALSTYVRSLGLFGNEMHSPIMCIGNGIPAIVCRFAEQTWKGLMWNDIGLQDWLFDLDVPEDVQKIVPTIRQFVESPDAAKEKALAARDRVKEYQRNTMTQLADALAAGGKNSLNLSENRK